MTGAVRGNVGEAEKGAVKGAERGAVQPYVHLLDTGPENGYNPFKYVLMLCGCYIDVVRLLH